MLYNYNAHILHLESGVSFIVSLRTGASDPIRGSSSLLSMSSDAVYCERSHRIVSFPPVREE